MPIANSFHSHGKGLSSMPPSVAAGPSIGSTPLVGSAGGYTAGRYNGNPAPVVTIQWLLDGNPIGSAINPTYLPIAGDEGASRLSVRETATNALGSVSSTSAVVNVNRIPAFTSAPSVQGAPVVGSAAIYLQGATVGFPAPTITQQWLLDAGSIGGATGTSYTPIAGNEGALRLSIRQTATNTAGAANNTSATVDINRLPAFNTAPTIVGTPVVGSSSGYTLGTVVGYPAPTVTQQWLLSGATIGGATASTYTPVAGNEGAAKISVRETLTNTAGSANSTSSAVDCNRIPSFVTQPSIPGSATVGTATSYAVGNPAGYPAPTVTQQWLLDGANISAATGATYTPVAGDVGANRLSVRETLTNAAGSASGTSAAVTVSAASGSLVTWDAVANATGYKVYWDTNGGPPYGNSADVGNVTSFTPAGLVSGTTYYFNVTSYDASGVEGNFGTQLQKVAP